MAYIDHIVDSQSNVFNLYSTLLANNIASQFNPSKSGGYAIGDYVFNGDDRKLYKFKVAHTGAWNINDVDEVTIKNEIDLVRNNIAAEFGAGAYAIGDYVTYNGQLYKFKAAHTANTAWSTSQVDLVTITEEIDEVKDALDNIDIETDTTLSVAGKPADSKTVGDNFNELYSNREIEQTLEFVDGLNFVANGTKYTSQASYGTYYFAIKAGQLCNLTFKSTSSNGFTAVIGFSSSVPVLNGSATYIGSCTVSAKSSNTFEFNATDNGYVSMTWWKDTSRSGTAIIIEPGPINQIDKLKTDVDDLKELTNTVENMNQELDSINETVNGIETEAIVSSVSGLNLVYGATKYNSSSNYTTYYIPVERSKKYKITFRNSTANIGNVRLGFSNEVPANNITAQFITEVSVAKNGGTLDYEYYGINEGYLTYSYYTGAITSNSATQNDGNIKTEIEVISIDVDNMKSNIVDMQLLLTEMQGQSVNFESGNYYNGSPTLESTTEAQIRTSTDKNVKRTMIELPAGKVLRIVGRGLSNATRLFFVFDAVTGLLIDVSGADSQLEVQSWYLRYDVDTHVYINCHVDYEKFIQIVDGISPWIDISKCYGQRNASVLDLNGKNNVRYAVRNLKKGAQNQVAPTVFIHCSDIHGDTLNLNRIVEFSKDPQINISDIICTGDIAYVSLDENGTNFLNNVVNGNKILVCPGNHDVATGTGSAVQYGTATPEQTYNALFAGKIDTWGVVQPENAATNFLGYFYKDYTATKIRAIFLDFNHGNDYINEQLTWFTSVLQDAYDNDYSVLCLNHYMFSKDYCTLVDCTFSIKGGLGNEGGWTIPESAVSVVEDFIGYGGKFICWLGGHVHNDFVLLHNNGHQMCIGVSTASYKSKQVQYCDNIRERGLKSQDLFNVVSIDTYSKKLSILRVGSDLSRFMVPRRRMCIDYVNRTVLWSD